MASELLERVLLAHAGLDRWNRFDRVQATIVAGGQLFGMKGTGLALERNLFLKLCISEPALARMRSYVEANITSPSRSIVVEGD